MQNFLVGLVFSFILCQIFGVIGIWLSGIIEDGLLDSKFFLQLELWAIVISLLVGLAIS